MRGPKVTLTIQTFSDARSTTGGLTRTWADTAYTITGVLTVAKGSERMSSDKKTVFMTHKFYCDYSSQIAEKKRFKYGTRYFDIVFVNDMAEQNKIMTIDLRETD